MRSQNIIFSVLLVLVTFSISRAQIQDTTYNGVNDPFSSYGLGTIDYDGLQTSAMMGHTGVAHQSTYIMNNANPASLADIRITTLDFSLRGVSSQAINSDQVVKSGSFQPSYLYLSFPIGKKAGMTLGIDQKLKTLYRINSLGSVQIGDSLLSAYQSWLGEGSLNYLNASGGYKWKNFNFGVRLDYNFGNQRSENFILFEDSVQLFGSDYLRTIQYNGLNVKLGLQYSQYLGLDSMHKLTFGAVFEPRSKISAKEEYYAKSFFGRTNFIIEDPDTFATSESARGKYHAPYSLRLGLGYQFSDKLEALVDYNYIDFRKSTLFNDSLNLGVFQKISLGMNYTPSTEPGKSTLSRTTYYAGFYLGEDYVSPNSNPLNFWGITGGLSIPFTRNVSALHLGVEYGSRGDVDQNLVRLNNTVYTLGISFSDIWFRKRYYD